MEGEEWLMVKAVLTRVQIGSIRGHGEGGASLAVPKSVLDEGVRITRESLEQICEVME